MGKHLLGTASPASRGDAVTMADEQDFRVFISWSGPLAKEVARVLREWLPTMFDRIQPWFSDTDIPAGATWFGEIQERLNSSDYGIVVITTANWQRPWLNFEAGALSKKLKEDTNKVTPVLVNFEDTAQLTGHPLEQYNAVMLDKDGMWRLCSSIARSATRNVGHVQQRFAQMWPSLSDQIKAAKKTTEEEQPPPPEVSEPQRLDALTASVRSLEATVKQLVGQNSSGSIVVSGDNAQSWLFTRPKPWSGTTTSEIRRDPATEIARMASAYRPVDSVALKESPTGTEAVLKLKGDKLTTSEATRLVNDLDGIGVSVDVRPLISDDSSKAN